jgi:hypothetical protein
VLDKLFLLCSVDIPDNLRHLGLFYIGESRMLSVSSALQAQFEERLRNRAIPKERHWLYRKWLRYYLDFCRKYRFPAGEKETLSPFLRKLEEKRQTKAQLEQAEDSITLYREIHDRKGRDAPLTKAKAVLSGASWQKDSGSAAAPGAGMTCRMAVPP